MPSGISGLTNADSTVETLRNTSDTKLGITDLPGAKLSDDDSSDIQLGPSTGIPWACFVMMSLAVLSALC